MKCKTCKNKTEIQELIDKSTNGFDKNIVTFVTVWFLAGLYGIIRLFIDIINFL